MAGPTLIQIKRSLDTGTTPSLANGELAFTANGDILFIGSNAATIPIASKRTPGTLTANQGLVANSLSLLDTIKLGNNIANVVISATGILLSNTDGEGNTITLTTPNTTEKGGNYYLKADGSWSTVTGATADPAGANTQIQYNDSAVMGGSAGFTFKEDSNTVSIGNTLALGLGTTNVVANTIAIRFANSTVTFDITSPTAAQNTSGNYFLGSNGIWQQVVSSGTLDSLTDVTISGIANNNLLVYDADASQWENHAVGNGFSFSGQVMAVLGGDGIVSNATGIHVGAGNGIAADADSIRVAVGTNGGLVSNATGTWLYAGPSLITNSTGAHVNVTSTGGLITNSTGLHVVSGDGLLTNSTGLHIGTANGINVTSDAVGLYTGSTLTLNSTGVHVNSALSIQDLVLAGNLTVSGTLTSLDVTNLTVTDPLIKLAEEQADTGTYTDTLDIGFIGEYGNTAVANTNFTGLFRDASDGIYKLFAGNIPAPTTTVDTANINFAYAKLFAQLRTGTGTGIFEANNTGTTITANDTWTVALTTNTLSVSGQSNLAAQVANSTGFYPSSNTVGQNLGNTISRWTILYAGGNANSSGLYPISNTVGQALGNTISRWEITANSLVLSTALAGTSGGTGLTTTVNNSIYFGNSTNGFNSLALGTTGHVLQSNGTALVYDTLDGGTFVKRQNTINTTYRKLMKGSIKTWKDTDLFMYGETGNIVDIT